MPGKSTRSIMLCLAVTTLLLIGALGSGAAFSGPPLPKASSPEEVGLSSERLARIERVIGSDIKKKQLPGAVIAVARRGKLAYTFVAGQQDPTQGTPITADSIFRIYSMTKPLVTVAALTLMEEGAIQLTDPVSKFLPAFKRMQVSVPQRDAGTGTVGYVLVPAEREITIHDLMRHTSGLTYGERTSNPLVRDAYVQHRLALAPFALTHAQFVEGLSKSPLVAQPGTMFEYGLSTDLLGAVIEVVTGKRLIAVLEERIFKPLGMTDTAFWVRPDKQGRLVHPFPTDPTDGAKADLHGLDTLSTEPAFDSSGAGSVSTLGDYLRFCQMLLNGGALEGVRILSRTSVQLMASDHMNPRIQNPLAAGEAALATPGYSFGLGGGVRIAAGMAGVPGSVGEFMWAGTGGTYFWVDPKEELIGVYMTQRPGPSRNYYRRLIKQLVYQAIID
jgi:CubicO group peptidase (beta-lactamase class C family)